jgi:hypothetical protein
MAAGKVPEHRAAGKGPMPEVDQLQLRARVDEILNRRPAVGFALGVVRGRGCCAGTMGRL